MASKKTATTSVTQDKLTPTSATSRPTNTLGSQVTDEQIARRAYELYLARGCEHGHDAEDWKQAERELRLGRQ